MNYVLFAFFGFIVFSLLLGLFIISCLHKRRAHIRLKTENSTEEKMTFSHTKIYETTPSRGSSARTRLCSVTPTGETPGLTPVWRHNAAVFEIGTFISDILEEVEMPCTFCGTVLDWYTRLERVNRWSLPRTSTWYHAIYFESLRLMWRSVPVMIS